MPFYSFSFDCAWSLLLPRLFSSCGQQVGISVHCSVGVSHCSGFSCCGAGTLWHSSFSSCSLQAWLLFGNWDLPKLGTEPLSPALAGRFFSIETPGKPYLFTSVVLFFGRAAENGGS